MKKAQELGSAAVEIKQKVLVLGAGRVSGPLVEYLTRDPSLKITTGKHMNLSKNIRVIFDLYTVSVFVSLLLTEIKTLFLLN